MTTRKGSCVCGAVSVEVVGDPQAMLVCHCFPLVDATNSPNLFLYRAPHDYPSPIT